MNMLKPASGLIGVFLAIGMSLAIATEPVEQEPVEQESPAAPLYQRFDGGIDQPPAGTEVPDFQKHVSPLLGRLGCNGRACHGSFQGQGGFQLSLFGYDFDADMKALMEEGAARVDADDPVESLILTKPVDADMHDGGKRYELGQWEYWVLRRWIEAGAPHDSKNVKHLERLEVAPREVVFAAESEQQQLQVFAHWKDGSVEDVTCLCRFQSNDDAITSVDENGLLKAGETGDTHVVVSYDKAVVPVLTLRANSGSGSEQYPAIAGKTAVDRLVVQKLKKLGIVPSELCSDEEFLRRASLDVTGTLPAAAEVLAFLRDSSPSKREEKIDELLSRDTYAAQWTTFLCDITGNNEDQLRNFLPQQVQPANQWYQWLYQRVRDNVPYDQIVEGIVTATSRLPEESYTEYCEAMGDICRDKTGEKFADRPGLVHYWARNNFRTAEDRAIGFAYSFLGVRIQCAQCHKHPFDQWSKADFDSFEQLFGRVQANQNTRADDAKREMPKMISDLGLKKGLKGNDLRRELGELLNKGETVPFPELIVVAPRNRPTKNSKNKKAVEQPVQQAKLLGGDWIDLDEPDVRGELMEWLRSPENPYFAKAIVNRVWAQYFGVGIVNPPDDLNLANAPSNAPLLDYLAAGFVESGFDLKWIHREIANSETYQRSWIPNETNSGDRRNFSHSQLRRLSAEATYDAVRMALARDSLAEQARELDTQRAITKPGSSARSNNRDDQSYALSVFGRSVRESNCDCDRSSEPSLLQTVFLLNDEAVQEWLSDPKTSWVSQVAAKYDWPATGGGPDRSDKAKRMTQLLDNLMSQLEKNEERLAAAKERGQQKQVEALSQARTELLARARGFAKKNGFQRELQERLAARAQSPQSTDSATAVAKPSAERMTDEQALWVAENAYLRTLGRLPNASELATSTTFLRSDENPTSGVEALMWSLINTKEFILNH